MKSTIFLNEMDAEAIRLIYVKIDQQRLKNGKYLTETSYNISNPYKLPEDMTLKDACYIASYVSNQLENDGLIEPKTEECVTKVASQLEKFGMVKIKNIQNPVGYFKKSAEYSSVFAGLVQTYVSEINKVADLFIVDAEHKIFTSTTLSKRYFPWRNRNASKEGVKKIMQNFPQFTQNENC